MGHRELTPDVSLVSKAPALGSLRRAHSLCGADSGFCLRGRIVECERPMTTASKTCRRGRQASLWWRRELLGIRLATHQRNRWATIAG
jgi:hypothetical protein